ncbi:SMI1/KNR4 family protein [Sphingobacterium bovistauri]|uniref:SMI1/KNR4 family protein n=1 Tax=Sphingobacterium bovistauri TaxID=2781959 RepID=A0ABS7Z6I7_9SPHI|nr:SMI1/KNR4 family protein [Sphingobacterium bovistauri]MCA5005207.1 SMI1/KNR4 family protein [Sphingobacterium bovistauri]
MKATTVFIKSIETLKSWITNGKVVLETKKWKDGLEITASEELNFKVERISNVELEEIKSYTNHSLPESYYHFLQEIGAGSFFFSKYIDGFDMYNLAQLKEYNTLFQQEIEDCEEEVKDQFIIIGSHLCMGDWMGFCTTKKEEKNFDVYCHEYPIDDYVATSDELNSWRTFEEWLIKAVETKGSETL